MDAEKSMSAAFDTLIKMDRGLPVGRQSSATEPGDEIVAFGATSIREIEKLMEELRTARDYLQSEGERVRRMNARYAHLTRDRIGLGQGHRRKHGQMAHQRTGCCPRGGRRDGPGVTLELA